MDRRTQDSKLVGKALADALREDLVRAADATALEYRRADRCRICGRDSRGLPNAIDVLTIVDRELAEEGSGFRCEECETVAKSRGGLLQHKRRKHANASSP